MRLNTGGCLWMNKEIYDYKMINKSFKFIFNKIIISFLNYMKMPLIQNNDMWIID